MSMHRFLRRSSSLALSLLACGLIADGARAATLDPRAFGALGDGATIDTRAIQAAIDEAATHGGGVVRLEGGTFVSGTVVLKSHVTLKVAAGATLLGSGNLADYPDITPAIPYQYTHRFTRYLIYAEGAEDISIIGRGTIDGRGRDFPYVRDEDKNRPYILRFAECRNVTVRNVTFLDSARWLQHYLGCEDVVIDGIRVSATTRENRDGIDIDSCDRVVISNCQIDSGDDAIVLKATANRPCQNVAITNCVVRSRGASGIKLGTESNGGFENITVSNCVVHDTGGDALALEMVDGGAFDRVTFSNIVIKNARTAIFVRLGNRARPIPGLDKPGMGSMRNIIIDNIQATGIGNWGCSVTGLPGHPVENVSISNVRIRFAGGGTQEDADREIEEKAGDYPSSKMFGILPAYGFFLRHVKTVNLANVDLSVVNPDVRPAVACKDVEALDIVDLDAEVGPETLSYIVLDDVHDAAIAGCRPTGATAHFLSMIGEGSRNISVYQNDLSRVGEVVKASASMEAEIDIAGNRGGVPR